MQRKDSEDSVPVAAPTESPAASFETASINQHYFDAQGVGEFVEGSPHLKHEKLRALCHDLLMQAYTRSNRSAKQLSVLNMGAGDGVLSLALLQKGARVSAVDATESLLQELQRRAASHQANLSIQVGDVFEVLKTQQKQGAVFDLICCSSFFHHIPDYLELCRKAIELLPPGGVFFSFQDPLRYDSMSALAYGFDRLSYFGWRMLQGNYVRGFKTRLRRLLGKYREDLPEDMAEYHVVRSGVDQDAIATVFREAGFDCKIYSYWSTQGDFFQNLGTRLKLKNTFGIIAQRA